MSASIEWVGAEDLHPDLIAGGQEAPDGQSVEDEDGHWGLVLASPDGTVVTGTLPELRRLFAESLEMIETEMSTQGMHFTCNTTCTRPVF